MIKVETIKKMIRKETRRKKEIAIKFIEEYADAHLEELKEKAEEYQNGLCSFAISNIDCFKESNGYKYEEYFVPITYTTKTYQGQVWESRNSGYFKTFYEGRFYFNSLDLEEILNKEFWKVVEKIIVFIEE